MKVNYKELRDKSMFYEVILDDDVLFTGIPKDIMSEFKFTASDWNKLHARKQSVDGLIIRPFGRMHLLFEHKGFVGTKDEILNKFDLKTYQLSQGHIKLLKVGYFFDCDADNRVIDEKKKKADSPNQKYIDSLFANCFKGWRA